MHENGARFAPAFGKTCDKCKRKNHFSRVCSSAPSANSAESYRPRRQVTPTHRQQWLRFILWRNRTCLWSSNRFLRKEYAETFTTKIWVQRSNSAFEMCEYILDSGATCNVVGESFLRVFIGDFHLQQGNPSMFQWKYGEVTIGTTVVRCKIDNECYKLVFHVINGPQQPILSANACQLLKTRN
jgi:hypothetical protein